MDSKTARPKTLAPQERTAALAAVATAKRKHRYVGVHPKHYQQPEGKIAGVLVPSGSDSGTALSRALWKASEAWPAENSWQILGCDDFSEFPDDGSCDELGDGYFGDPSVYGEFGTLDEPGWMGGYPA